MSYWNDRVKRLLRSELVKKGISHSELAKKLAEIGIEETKSSIDSKISRGTFSATFLIQCLTVIGCDKLEVESYQEELLIAAESEVKYHSKGKQDV